MGSRRAVLCPAGLSATRALARARPATLRGPPALWSTRSAPRHRVWSLATRSVRAPVLRPCPPGCSQLILSPRYSGLVLALHTETGRVRFGCASAQGRDQFQDLGSRGHVASSHHISCLVSSRVAGPGSDMFESTRIIAEKQANLSMQARRSPSFTVRLCRAALVETRRGGLKVFTQPDRLATDTT